MINNDLILNVLNFYNSLLFVNPELVWFCSLLNFGRKISNSNDKSFGFILFASKK